MERMSKQWQEGQNDEKEKKKIFFNGVENVVGL